ncbi:hypothetical protein EPK99_06195 [Neorhizobium lilium]|uniref:Uncharacterized protein n=1 Tax=Neorhizobium lilium TaxID=2503024 RepID=A0A3S3SZ92_9HYPH|nr:hypothetical protein [Neorhizobium lilium]RWX78224.1 hypothetical protein EPK99_06195 [Neorhizobium lilium]
MTPSLIADKICAPAFSAADSSKMSKTMAAIALGCVLKIGICGNNAHMAGCGVALPLTVTLSSIHR